MGGGSDRNQVYQFVEECDLKKGVGAKATHRRPKATWSGVNQSRHDADSALAKHSSRRANLLLPQLKCTHITLVVLTKKSGYGGKTCAF